MTHTVFFQRVVPIVLWAGLAFCQGVVHAADDPRETLKAYLNVLTNRVEGLESTVRSMPNNSQVLGRLEAVELSLETVKEIIKDNNAVSLKTILEDLKATSTRIDAVANEVNDIKRNQNQQVVANKEMSKRIDELEGAVDDLKKRIPKPPVPVPGPQQIAVPPQKQLVWEQYSWQCARCGRWHLSWRQITR